MTNFKDIIGNTVLVFGSNIELESFKAEIIDSTLNLTSDVYEPEYSIVQLQFGTLYIEVRYFLKSMLLNERNLIRANVLLRHALGKYLTSDYEVKYPDQVGYLLHSKGNRFIVKAIVTLAEKEPPVKFSYLKHEDGTIMCNDCAEKHGNHIAADTFTYVQEDGLLSKPPICDFCNSALTKEDTV